MTKDQLDGLKGVFVLSEKLDTVLNKSPHGGALTQSRVSKVRIEYLCPENKIHTMSIEDDERITIRSSLQGIIEISEKKRATLAALADMIGTALVSTLKEEHEEVTAKIASLTVETN